MRTATEEPRRRGRPRKSRRNPAGQRKGHRRLLRDDYSEEEDDDNSYEHEYDEDEDEGHEKQRVKKKLKLLLKLHRRDPSPPPPRLRGREPSPESSVSFHDDAEVSDGDREVERKRLDCNGKGSAAFARVTPLPDRKTLEFILDKIQKKDKYNVFAEPVDLDELPDYLEIIEHPMDFGTIRKKLARNRYANLENFEADVFLVCTNAMQYNAPETIYHKQAQSMQEVARESFQRVRAESRFSESLIRPELNDRPNYLEKEPPKSCSKTPYETGGSDTSSVAVAANENSGFLLKTAEATGSDKSIKDSGAMAVDASFTVVDSMPESVEKPEKVEELSEKAIPSKSEHKIVSADEIRQPVDMNRRTTYNISNQCVVSPRDSVISTLEPEDKQLVAVGLDPEYSYARSLARFAAPLGPTGWRIASEKIEKVLPTGLKYGPGWVGEYEPPPIAVLSVVDNIRHKQSNSVVDKIRADSNEDKSTELKTLHNAATSVQMGKPCSITSYSSRGNNISGSDVKKCTNEGNVESKLSPFQFLPHHQSENTQHFICKQKEKTSGVPWKDKKTMEPRQSAQTPSSACSVLPDCTLKNSQFHLETMGSGFSSSLYNKSPTETSSNKGVWVARNQAQMPMNSGFSLNKDATSLCQVPTMNATPADGKSSASSPNHGRTLSGSMPRSIGTMNDSHTKKDTTREITDSVKSARVMPEISLKLQNFSNSGSNNSTRQFIPTLSPKNHPSAATGTEKGTRGVNHIDGTPASTSMNTWISIGNYSASESAKTPGFLKMQTESHVYRPNCMPPLTSGICQATNVRSQLPSSYPQVTNGRPLLPLSNHMIAEKSEHPNNNPSSFSLMFSTELPRPQHMISWRGPGAHSQQRKSEDLLPPDLNIGFQSPGSPIPRPSGIRVDSQPDLALQL